MQKHIIKEAQDMNQVLIIVSIPLLFLLLLYVVYKAMTTSKTNNAEHKDNSTKESGTDRSYKKPLNIGDDKELVAVLTAAVVAYMGSGSASNIKVKSYRRIPQSSPIWNLMGRKEQIDSML
jgi:Na+-transporting methylmalonyl-CoA/oxaloacetate decarboxylase gamma subunit